MDQLTQLAFTVQLHSEFQTRGGDAFQRLFEQIMSLRYPADFAAVCPWGQTGDRKNDGYLRSERKLFQCYAPRELTVPKTLRKMQRDFDGAKPFWKDYFSDWVFVHNVVEGLPADVLEKLLSFEKEHVPIKAPQWGFPEIKAQLLALRQDQVESIIGRALTYDSFTTIGFADLEVVVTSIAATSPPAPERIRPVPPGKIEANALSVDVAEYLRIGMQRADLVKQFFRQWHDPTLGDRTAKAFRDRYGELRSRRLSPDQIFSELRIFAQGAAVREPRHEAAVLAVVAFLFEECDIFERPQIRSA